ncbi:MAG TPA: hypothetical protein PLN55_14380 [Burkholderiaceae bacterium]|nr:hypothetical protein [Burkholderiaceae bacterium]
MSATQDLSIGLQDVASRLDEDLALLAGEPVAWVLICQVDDVAQYVSNANRKDGAALIESLLERWKAGRADIPAHYNPDLAPPKN